MTAFITRDLSESSEFRKMLAAGGWQTEGRSLVELSPLPFGEIPAADWIFFSSKNAVRFFFKMNSAGGLRRVKWAALGAATAKALAEFVGEVDFIGTGEPKETAAAFRRFTPAPPPGEEVRILFPEARHSRQSVMPFLSPDFQCIHFPVYDNRPVAAPLPSTADVLVFTSPMNAQAYFSKHPLQKHQRVVAIGETTAGALRELGIQNVVMAREATERALAEAVLLLNG